MRLEADDADTGRVAACHVERRVTDGDGVLGRPAVGALARELDQARSVLGLAAEGALARREEASQAQPLHPGTGHRLGISCQEGGLRHRRHLAKRSLEAVRGLPISRVRAREQLDVAFADAGAPAREVRAGETQLAPLSKRGLTGSESFHVHVDTEELPRRMHHRLSDERVVAQQKRPVDLAEDQHPARHRLRCRYQDALASPARPAEMTGRPLRVAPRLYAVSVTDPTAAT